MNKKGNVTRMKPIKTDEDVRAMAAYLKKTDSERGQAAYIIWLLCVNGGLRVTDALELRIANLCGQGKRVRTELTIAEKKTGKLRCIPLGQNTRNELQNYIDSMNWKGTKYQSYLFPSSRNKGKHVSYQWMYNRVKEAAAVCGMGKERSGTHIMRKTFARKWYDMNLERFGGSVNDCAMALQKNILHHANLSTTLRYIDAEADYLRETCRGIDITI